MRASLAVVLLLSCTFVADKISSAVFCRNVGVFVTAARLPADLSEPIRP